MTNSSPDRRATIASSRCGGGEPGGDDAERFVAGAVPETVVDALEAVEVDEVERHGTATLRLEQHVSMLEDDRPVREPGQRI